jgi:hypothetical protein
MKRSLPRNRKLTDGTGDRLAQGLDLLERDSKAQGGEALQDTDEQVLQLQPGQVGPETEVRAVAQ